MIWQVPRMWENGDVWILGGGPSVPVQFDIPKEVIQKVVAGASPPSVYSPYMSFLHNKHVIGINVAYMIGDWIDIIFFGDSAFLEKHQVGLAAFPGLKICCNPVVDKSTWVKYCPMDRVHARGISDNPCAVSWNGNSGAAAISIAANTGAKRIFLLGFDMCLNSTKNQHWHDIYNRGPILTEKRQMHLPFEKHMRGFEQMAKDAKRRGIEIINVNPDSAIKEFRKVSLKELL